MRHIRRLCRIQPISVSGLCGAPLAGTPFRKASGSALVLVAGLASSACGQTQAQNAQPAAANETPISEFRDTPAQLAVLRPTGGQGSSNNSGVEEVVILGDPAEAGVYSMLLKVAPNTRIAAHHHDGNRVGTVLEGTRRIGYGETFDESALKVLPAGSIYSEPNQGPTSPAPPTRPWWCRSPAWVPPTPSTKTSAKIPRSNGEARRDGHVRNRAQGRKIQGRKIRGWARGCFHGAFATPCAPRGGAARRLPVRVRMTTGKGEAEREIEASLTPTRPEFDDARRFATHISPYGTA